MTGTVTKLCMPDSLVIPEEMLVISPDEEAVEQQINQLGLRCAKKVWADKVCPGDVAHCKADKAQYPDGREILIYTGVSLPGAEAAAAALLGKAPGEAVQTTLAGKSVTLTVEKILRLVPVKVEDSLIPGLGIDGVSTLEDYRRYLLQKQLEDTKMERSKEIIRFLMDSMLEGSEFSYDIPEMEQEVDKAMAQVFAQAQAENMPMDMPEDALRQSIREQMEQTWLAQAYCEKAGIAIDTAAAQEEADQMEEMMHLMGEPVPSKEALLSEALENQALNAMFEALDALVHEKLGG